MKKSSMSEKEPILMSEKLLKFAFNNVDDKLDNITKKILILEAMGDNKLNDNVTQLDLLTKAKDINKELTIKLAAKQIDNEFLTIENNVRSAERLIRFAEIYMSNIKNIVMEIINLFYSLDPLLLEKDYNLMIKTISKCVTEIDNIIEKAYYGENHVLYLTGVDKVNIITLQLFECSNEKLNIIISNKMLDDIDFIFCMPIVDTISLGLFRYSLENEYSYHKHEFIEYINITNMQKYINKHILNFEYALDKITQEQKMVDNFKEILRLKKEIFNEMKFDIIQEYLIE
jgi:hypothetical protein